MWTVPTSAEGSAQVLHAGTSCWHRSKKKALRRASFGCSAPGWVTSGVLIAGVRPWRRTWALDMMGQCAVFKVSTRYAYVWVRRGMEHGVEYGAWRGWAWGRKGHVAQPRARVRMGRLHRGHLEGPLHRRHAHRGAHRCPSSGGPGTPASRGCCSALGLSGPRWAASRVAQQGGTTLATGWCHLVGDRFGEHARGGLPHTHTHSN